MKWKVSSQFSTFLAINLKTYQNLKITEKKQVHKILTSLRLNQTQYNTHESRMRDTFDHLFQSWEKSYFMAALTQSAIFYDATVPLSEKDTPYTLCSRWKHLKNVRNRRPNSRVLDNDKLWKINFRHSDDEDKSMWIDLMNSRLEVSLAKVNV